MTVGPQKQSFSAPAQAGGGLWEAPGLSFSSLSRISRIPVFSKRGGDGVEMGFTFTGHLSGARNFVSHQDLESIEKHNN